MSDSPTTSVGAKCKYCPNFSLITCFKVAQSQLCWWPLSVNLLVNHSRWVRSAVVGGWWAAVETRLNENRKPSGCRRYRKTRWSRRTRRSRRPVGCGTSELCRESWAMRLASSCDTPNTPSRFSCAQCKDISAFMFVSVALCLHRSKVFKCHLDKISHLCRLLPAIDPIH